MTSALSDAEVDRAVMEAWRHYPDEEKPLSDARWERAIYRAGHAAARADAVPVAWAMIDSRGKARAVYTTDQSNLGAVPLYAAPPSPAAPAAREFDAWYAAWTTLPQPPSHRAVAWAAWQAAKEKL